MRESRPSKNLFGEMQLRARALALPLALLLVSSQSAVAEALPGQDIDPQVEEAVLSANWPLVGSLLDSVTPQTPFPVLRIIKGHADLALNRHNESLSLFAQLSFEDLEIWKTWSESFVSRNLTQSIPHYFLGDASARKGNIDQARAHFARALELDENNYLAWNARGVTSVLLDDYDNSMEDFSRALSAKSDFLDALNSVGMMRIHQGQGRKGALLRFRSIVKLHADFALAYHGLGCMELLAAQEFSPEENSNIQRALELAPPGVRELLIANEGRFLLAYFEKTDGNVIVGVDEEGTAIKKDFILNDLARHADKASSLRSQLPANTPDYQRNMASMREHQADYAVALEFSSKTQVQQRGFAANHSDDMGRTLASISRLESRYKSGMDEVSSASSLTDRSLQLLGAIFPLVSAVDIGTKQFRADAISRPQQLYADLRRLKADAVEIRDHTIRTQIEQGTYRPAAIPDQTIPSGAAFRIESRPISRPMENPAGATTNKSLVVWDDEDWPFTPIFGLLYFSDRNFRN